MRLACQFFIHNYTYTYVFCHLNYLERNIQFSERQKAVRWNSDVLSEHETRLLAAHCSDRTNQHHLSFDSLFLSTSSKSGTILRRWFQVDCIIRTWMLLVAYNCLKITVILIHFRTRWRFFFYRCWIFSISKDLNVLDAAVLDQLVVIDTLFFIVTVWVDVVK